MVPLPESTLLALREYYKTHRNKKWIFPAEGKNHSQAATADKPMSDIATTMIYTHVLARPDVRVVSSPLDRLERNEPGGNASERNASERNASVRNASVRNKIEGNAMQGNALGISALGISALERPVSRVEDVGSHGTECRATLEQIAELPKPIDCPTTTANMELELELATAFYVTRKIRLKAKVGMARKHTTIPGQKPPNCKAIAASKNMMLRIACLMAGTNVPTLGD